MSKIKQMSVLLLSIATLGFAVAGDAVAREGGWRSVGQGIKCINQVVLQPNGTYRVQQVCANRG